jgi:hypothetical protein
VKKLRRVRLSIGVAALAAFCATALALSATASAQLTVGQLAPSSNPEATCEYGAPYDEFQVSVATGNSFVMPSAGVITSWSTLAGGEPTGQVMGMKVFRRIGAGAYFVVGQDVRALTPGLIDTYPVAIPVQAGDILGVTLPAEGTTSCHVETELEGDVITYKEGNVGPGGIAAFREPFVEAPELEGAGAFHGSRINLSATLLPPPTIAALSPVSAPITGGPVAVAGANFADVTGVSFGSVSVPFTVSSEGQITATAPASATLGAVPVMVTTAAGVATAPAPFTYVGCAVPKLQGKKLKGSKKVSAKFDCKVGKVTKRRGATAKTGRVVQQKPAPGKILAPGTKINVTLK